MVDSDYRFCVGIDWASEAHQACVLDHERRIVAERSFAHTGSAVTEFAEWLSELAGDPGCVAIAIEIPRGAVVETLVERGVHVYAINPKQLDRFRDRHNVSGAKDDRRDAFVLADSVRTDRPCFRRVRLEDPLVIQLRELSRIDEDLRREANQLTNRLREQLQRFYAQMLKLCPAADEPWLWALLELAPSPASRGGCGPSVLKSCSRNTAFAACRRRRWERCCRPRAARRARGGRGCHRTHCVAAAASAPGPRPAPALPGAHRSFARRTPGRGRQR